MEETNILQNNMIEIYEEFTGFKLPKDYKLFLQLTNGGKPKKRYFTYKNRTGDGSLLSILFGFNENKYRNIIRYYNNTKGIVPNNMIPIGIDQGSNIILLSVKGPDYGKIYFADHETETEDFNNLLLLADSFEEFINNLKNDSEIEG